ncbi:MAG: M20 family peptidase [Fulvivirga sp.]
MKKILLFILLVALLLASVVLYNTFTFKSKQIQVEPVAKIDIPATAKDHMSQAIQIPTISNANPADFDSTAFDNFKKFVKDTYPLTDSLLEINYINEYSMVMKLAGSNETLKPVIFMGHLDVVPVPQENRSKWSADPFGGEIKNGQIWGRGAIDDKISVIGNMEALELLLGEGFSPERTIYFCYGHDEELGGVNGAIPIVNYLKEKGVEAEYVVDEGFAITKGMIPGIEKEVALIGTAEKGFVTYNLSIDIMGGHSSMPAPESAIDILSRAIVKLKDNLFPVELSQPVKDFMTYAGPEMPFVQKMAFANPWLFESMIMSTYSKTPSGNALIRTTTAPTIINAGVKDNVIPYQAKASVNFRILPGSSIEEVRNHVVEVIDDERIKVEIGDFASEPPRASPTDAFGYISLEKTNKEIFPEVLITPNLVIGATDSRHYYEICDNIYRFTPFHLNSENISTFHGIDERIPVADFEDAVRFYYQLIKNSGRAL